MGVSGSGKTTVGELLAEELGWSFSDADWQHPPANVEKMRAGIPLSEEDRLPWLHAVAALIRERLDAGIDTVLACSALTERSRHILRSAAPRPADLRIVHLRGSKELVRERLNQRDAHFMSPALLESQFDALEEPEGGIAIEIAAAPAEIVSRIRQELAL